MRKKRMIIFALMAGWLAIGALGFAEEGSGGKQTANAEGKELVALRNQALEMKVDSLEREISGVSRRLERLESQIERLDRDVKNLKFR